MTVKENQSGFLPAEQTGNSSEPHIFVPGEPLDAWCSIILIINSGQSKLEMSFLPRKAFSTVLCSSFNAKNAAQFR